ncbi:MAG: ABC transporter ATP-binding protein [Mobilitalea sp.]
MFKLLKFLKKSIVPIIIITALLFLQAACDLALPSYTSDIVNVGIIKSGINSATPDILRSTELDKLTLFMTDAEKAIILPHYTLLSEADYSKSEWADLSEKYPRLAAESIYFWDGEAKDEITDAFALPMTIVYSLENDSNISTLMKESLLANMPADTISEDMDVFEILALLPAEANAAMIPSVREQFSVMPELTVTQTAISYVSSEYKAVGVDVSKIQTDYILHIGIQMIAIALAAMLASILVTFLSARVAAKMGRDLRSSVFHKVLSFSNTEMDQFSTASLITRSTNDIQQVQMLIVMMLRMVIYSPILAIGGIIKVLNTDTSMGWILVVAVAAVLILIGSLLIVAMPKFKIMQKLVDRINLVMREILTGLPVIRAFSTVDYEEKRFDKANVDLTKNSLFVNRVMTFMMPALMLIMNLISILIIWASAKGIDAGTMQIGDMIAFIQYTMQIIISFLMLSMVSIILPRAAVAAKRIDEILSTQTVIKDPEIAETINSNLKGVLEFKNVTFRYPLAEEDVLSDITFTAKPGETTAIIGSTGCGKSTLINLIPRFYNISSGKILIDGTDITKMTQHNLRDKLGYVPQKGVLFSGTIESNIKFGNPEATIDFVKRAARIAQAEEFIDAKTEGYDSSISEGGTNVSGGQKQRLSIARAIAKDPEIYIFDDSFSALDYKTDSTLRKTLKEEISDSTVIIVAQRISTIMNAEQILVLDDGRIVGKGTHKELLQNCEVYQQIASSQLSKEELDYEQ